METLKDFKEGVVKASGLKKRLTSGSPMYYQEGLKGYLVEMDKLQTDAFMALKDGKQDEYNSYLAKQEDIKKNAVKFLEPAKNNYPDLYEKIVVETKSADGKIKKDIRKSVIEATKESYIKENFDKNVYQAYKLSTPKIRAMYIYDQVKTMTPEQKKTYLGILYNLGIANEANQTGLEYNKLVESKNK
jgi:hypothetical protein